MSWSELAATLDRLEQDKAELLEALEAVERAEPLWLPHDVDPQYAHEEEALHKLAGKVRAAIAKAKS